MDAIAFIAEERIRAALEEGAFESLPGMGSPFPPDQDAQVPEDMRMAYTLLKNAGYLAGEEERRTMLPSPRECLPEEEAAAYGGLLRLEVFRKKHGVLKSLDAKPLETQYLERLLNRTHKF